MKYARTILAFAAFVLVVLMTSANAAPGDTNSNEKQPSAPVRPATVQASAPTEIVETVSTTDEGFPRKKEPEVRFYKDDIPYIVILLLILFGPPIYFLWRKWREAGVYDGMEVAESRFEKDLLSELGVNPSVVGVEQGKPHLCLPAENPASAPETAIEPASSIATPVVAMAPPPPTSPAPAPVQPSPAASLATPPVVPKAAEMPQLNNPPADLDDLASRLFKLTVIGDLEGQVPLSHPPNGRIYKLRKGGYALLLPRLETPEFMAHQARRFELILVLTHSGEVLVVSRLQSQLSQIMDRPGDFSNNMGSILGG